MNLLEEFKDIIPYAVSVSVGGSKANMSRNSDNRSYANFKGKMYPNNRKPQTLEELANGVPQYVMAQDISLPIKVSLVDGEDLTMVVEKTSPYTNKKSTEHNARIFNKDGKQIGYVSIDLNAAGDITSKTCFYENPEDTHNIHYTLNTGIKDGKIQKEEHFTFEIKDGNSTKVIKISQTDGKIVGMSSSQQRTKTKEEIQFQSITDFTIDPSSPQGIRTYVANNISQEKDYKKRRGLLIPWECRTLEDDLFEYRKKCEVLESYKDRKFIRRDVIDFCEDPSNDLYAGFRGDYIGNIFNLTDNGYIAYVVTTQAKDNNNFNLYTMLNLEGTNINQGTNPCAWDYEEGRDKKYFEAVKSADRTPRFVTQVLQDGSERLVLYEGQKALESDCPEYAEFKSTYLDPFTDIEPISIGKLLDKARGKEK